MSFEANYDYRTGIGTDIHRLVPDRELKLGGVVVPYAMGLLGHSDGDAALHAVTDAILGAAAMGDIGTLFPDDTDEFKDADSRQLLLDVAERIGEAKWEVVNVDLTIHAEQPKLGPYKTQMKRAIASILGVDFVNVNVKAKTNEGLGEIGAGNAIAATAVVLLRRRLKRTL
ncbi:MAG: 2-C-methyl-D-erythritol 2,4-cyclodiphosphate synthase [Planctomycetes bacterium]|nr:2-C-methyl-D-erythritol 2,4-cyclodiphosphate synthase [Planctomycetota bacterium]